MVGQWGVGFCRGRIKYFFKGGFKGEGREEGGGRSRREGSGFEETRKGIFS